MAKKKQENKGFRSSSDEQAELKKYILACREEADEAKQDRINLNRDNFDMFHLRHNFSHKKKGQSREVLSKQRMAVIQIVSFFQQALADIGEWWRVEEKVTGQLLMLSPEEIQKLTNWQMEQQDYYSHVGNCVQSGLLQSLIISKTAGKLIPKTRFETTGKKGQKKVLVVDDKTWRIQQTCVSAENFYPDPVPGRGLYEIEEMWIDYHDMIQLSKGDDPLYNKKVNELSMNQIQDYEEQQRVHRETDQNTTRESHIPQVKLTEFWGDVVINGELEYENVVITLANEQVIIRGPEPNPLWHQGSPYTCAPLIEVANSVWHTSIMDAATKHNNTLIEMYNLMLDASLKAVHGISQINIDALADAKQVSGNIPWGTVLKTNSSLAPGQKVMESVVTGDVPQDIFTMMNVVQQEFNASSMSSDLRQGVMPFRQVKATEVVETSNTITSVFQGVAKNVEQKLIQKELDIAWKTVCQNLDLIDKAELVALFGKERGEAISQMDPQEVFVNTVNGTKFKVFGISLTLSKAMDFRKWTTLLQTVFANEMLLEIFLQKYDPTKFLNEILISMDIDKSKIEIPEAQLQAQEQQQAEQQQAGPAGPDMMSQVPQAGAGSLADIFGGGAESGIPQSNFPGSVATQGGQQ